MARKQVPSATETWEWGLHPRGAAPGAQMRCECALTCSGVTAWTAGSASTRPSSASAVCGSRGEAAGPEQLEGVCADGKAHAAISKQQSCMASSHGVPANKCFKRTEAPRPAR